MMQKQINRKLATRKRHLRVRKKISGTGSVPRLSLYRSNKHIFLQLIDDEQSLTLVSASTQEASFKKDKVSGSNVEGAKLVGRLIAERAVEKGLKQVRFDRGGNLYHGRVAAVADAAREAGLEF